MLNRILRPVAQIAQKSTRQCSSNYKSPNFKYASMDELPLPSGSWQQHYDSVQKKYNRQLALSIITLCVSIAIAKYCGALYMNAGPPKRKQVKENE